MALTDALRGVKTLGDLPALMAALGHEPLWEALDPRPWPAATVARSGDFTWLALESSAPEADALRTARRFAAEGRPMGVLAFYSSRRQLAIGVSFGTMPVLCLHLDQPDAVPLACFGRLAQIRGGNILSVAARVADALAGKGAGHAFFREFRIALERMGSALPPPIPPADRHALALVQLTRVLFLYFIQAKGWLAGREDYLARMVDQTLARRRHLQRDLLQPLFFGTLNRPLARRGHSAAALGSIPFLNGGLFEPHPLEQRWDATFPNRAWRDAFDGLFERFHFTVSEREGGAIAPDMLGRVFEGVMDPAERQESGTFYTPAALVRRLVDAALLAHIGARLGRSDEEAERCMAARAPEALRVLHGITVLDPAVGSGAFLLGALERLAQFRSPHHPAHARRAILRRNLFGVDRNAMAVRLTELRLWLAVVAEESDSPSRVTPLPNLDCLIRQGDSLADPAPPTPGRRVAGEDVGRLRRHAIGASGPDKRAALGALRRAERRAAADVLARSEEATRNAIGALLEAARAPTLFGDRPRLAAAPARELAALRATLRAIRAGRRRLVTEGELPWFDYASQFPDVAAAGGFDLVIGNPPWVRAETLAPAVRERLAARYRWWRGSAGRGFGHRPDLSVAFLERACELTAPNGAVALLVPAKLAAAGYAARARAAIATGMTLHAVVDLADDDDAEFNATIYPMALVATQRPPAEFHQVRASLDPGHSNDGPQQRYLDGAPWVIRQDPAARVARELASRHPPLSERYACRLGAKTGADGLFLDPPDAVEPALVRGAIRGRDVGPFRATVRRTIVWPYDVHGRLLDRLPAGAAAFLERHASALRARSDYRSGPVWSVFRTGPATAAHRVIWPDLARSLAAVALDDRPEAPVVPLNTCYVIVAGSTCRAHALAAWLNCTWIRVLAALVAQPAASGYRRFGSATVGSLPLPRSVESDPALAAVAVRMAAGTAGQAELDEVAAGHLELSNDARHALAAAEHAGHRR